MSHVADQSGSETRPYIHSLTPLPGPDALWAVPSDLSLRGRGVSGVDPVPALVEVAAEAPVFEGVIRRGLLPNYFPRVVAKLLVQQRSLLEVVVGLVVDVDVTFRAVLAVVDQFRGFETLFVNLDLAPKLYATPRLFAD